MKLRKDEEIANALLASMDDRHPIKLVITHKGIRLWAAYIENERRGSVAADSLFEGTYAECLRISFNRFRGCKAAGRAVSLDIDDEKNVRVWPSKDDVSG